MKRIEWYMNMIYYNVFRLDNWGQRVVNKLFYPIIKPLRHLTGQSEEQMQSTMRNMHDPKYGVVSVQAAFTFGTLMSFSYGSFCFILAILTCSLIQISAEWYSYSFGGFLIGIFLGFLIDYILVFRKDNYLKYFKEFEKWSTVEKRKWSVVTVIFAFFALCLFMFSFWLLAYLDPYHA